MLGGAHRGPVAPSRQRRTIRLVQALLIVMGLGLVVAAFLSLIEVTAFDPSGVASFDRPRPPSWGQPIVLAILALVSLGAASVLGLGRTVKLPTPARLEEFVGRAEGAAIDRAERSAAEARADTPSS